MLAATDETMIMRFSFNAFVQKIILETEIKLKMMKDYIHKYERLRRMSSLLCICNGRGTIRFHLL